MTSKFSYAWLLVFTLFLFSCESDSESVPLAQDNAEVLQPAAVAIPDKYGAQISEEILRAGGNAVDAAVAVGFSLAVTFIDAGNIGGGGFMLIHVDGETVFLDYRETAPMAASRDMYLDERGDVVENANLIGGQAAGVPGTVAGFWAAHQRFGKLPWKDVIAPAIKLAEEGFVPADVLVNDIHRMHDWFGDATNFNEHFSRIRSGELFKQPELGRTLRRIADNGADEFYRGETAELLVSQMGRSNGLITAEDLDTYEAVWREPLRADWRDYEVVSAPPPSSGGFAVIQLLKMKDYLQHHFDGLAHNSPQYIHLVAEMEKRVFADRAEYLGDPEFVELSMDELISEDYIARRALEVSVDQISELSGVQPGLESPNTTHYSIIDHWGNAVSNT